MAKIIEFYGPPGTGKTTLGNLAIKYLRGNKVSVIGEKEAKFLGYKKWLRNKNNNRYPIENKFIETFLNLSPKPLQKRLIQSEIFGNKNGYYQDMINNFIVENLEFYILFIK